MLLVSPPTTPAALRLTTACRRFRGTNWNGPPAVIMVVIAMVPGNQFSASRDDAVVKLPSVLMSGRIPCAGDVLFFESNLVGILLTVVESWCFWYESWQPYFGHQNPSFVVSDSKILSISSLHFFEST